LLFLAVHLFSFIAFLSATAAVPAHAVAPNVVVVISDVDPTMARNDHESMRTGIFSRYRIDNLHDPEHLEKILLTLRKQEKIDVL
jgi:hypothetical protein